MYVLYKKGWEDAQTSFTLEGRNWASKGHGLPDTQEKFLCWEKNEVYINVLGPKLCSGGWKPKREQE